MSEAARPLLMLAMPDDGRRRALIKALAGHPLGVEVACAGDPDALVASCKARPPTVLLVDHRLAGGVALIDRLASELPVLPRVALLFDDAFDQGRRRAAAAGIIDFVFATPPPTPGEADAEVDGPLLGLVERLVTREVLESRLDATTVQFRALVDNSTDGIYILQKGNRVVYANPRFTEMVGYTLEELAEESFSIRDRITAPESRRILDERLRRVRAGEPVAPRYEFVAMRSDGQTFDAQVSVSYITFRGQPASLGIMRDVTERKRFEDQLVRKNRELALLQDLAASINEAVELDDLLRIGCRRLHDLLKSGATGITLLSPDGATLVLKASEGLSDEVRAVLATVPVDHPTLLAEAVTRGEVQIVQNLALDDRVRFLVLKDLGFEGAMVVPVKVGTRVLGAAFVFTERGRSPSLADRELMVGIGYQLGTAIEKASLLEQERASVKSLTALDEIALAIASRLEAKQIADTVARAVQRIYGPRRVVLARLDDEDQKLRPLCAVDGDRDLSQGDLSLDDSLLGEALERRAVLMRVAGAGGHLAPNTQAMFDEGIGTAVAIPVISDGELGGGLLLGFEESAPLDAPALAALGALSPHVAVAMKNADLFEARKKALEDLKAAQDKLVQSEKLRALGELAAGVAHDFNNVLGAILGRAQLLKAQLLDPELKKHALIIEKAATDGAETVRRIQAIGRQEAPDEFVAVDLADIVLDVIDLTQPRWRDRPREEGRVIELRTELAPGPLLVAGSPHELREVLINLVHNAVDAMPQGGTLSLGTERSTLGERPAGVVFVRDTGVGMPPAVKERIFDPFFTTKGDRGTGLGLSVSYSIIQRHGGDIEVRSETEGEHHGTTFRITLPEGAPADAASAEAGATPSTALLGAALAAGFAAAPPPLPDGRAGALVADGSLPLALVAAGSGAMARAEHERVYDDALPRILVIDDEENIRDILTEILETGGYEVVTAIDGPEGLALLSRVRVDLVFTDLGLPGMSGYEVAAAVKHKFPDLPVGLVTGWGATLDPRQMRDHGVDLILPKPFKFEQVLGLVQEAMAAARA